MSQRLLILDADTTWVHSLFEALPIDWSADWCGSRTVGLSPWAWRRASAEGRIPVPGWTRLFRISTSLYGRSVAGHIKNARAIVHTIPWTAGLLDRFRDVPHVYRPHDFFGMYSWNQNRVAELEDQLLAKCRLVLPITETQAIDFRQKTTRPTRVLPNAVSQQFVQRLRGPMPARPTDLPAGKPVVGCIGQINRGYDIDLCQALADGMPEAAFVYVGPVMDDDPTVKQRIAALFACPNVTWLGPKPHEQLPDYLRHFDVCFNPLQAIACNDRRSPLRLYDYLATGKPILSTNVAAAREHAPHVEPCASAADAITSLRTLINPGYHVDDINRRKYVDANTWNERAKQLVRLVGEFCP